MVIRAHALLAAAAEKAIEITRSLIDLAKIEHGLSKPLTMWVTYLSEYFLILNP